MIEPIRENSFICKNDDSLYETCKKEFSFLRNKKFFNALILENRLFINKKSVLEIIGKNTKEPLFSKKISELNTKKGDSVVLITSQSEEPPADLNYEIIFEDEELMIVSKSGNCPVHPAGKYYFNSLQIQLERDGKGTLHPAHRLDRETSGLIIFAKNKNTLSKLHKSFAKGEIKKRYEAIVFGNTPKEKTIEESLIQKTVKTKEGIFRDIVVCSDEKNSKQAITSFKTKRHSKNKNFSLLSIKIIGGRKHQIRVHLSCKGWPLVGDSLYGNSKEEFIELHKLIREGHPMTNDKIKSIKKKIIEKTFSKRQLLHSSFLKFKHPIKGDCLTFEIPLTKDINSFIEEWF